MIFTISTQITNHSLSFFSSTSRLARKQSIHRGEEYSKRENKKQVERILVILPNALLKPATMVIKPLNIRITILAVSRRLLMPIVGLSIFPLLKLNSGIQELREDVADIPCNELTNQQIEAGVVCCHAGPQQ